MSDIIQLSASDRLALVTKAESDLFDKKAAKIDGRGVQKIAVAFANADGGEFVIGIADDRQEPNESKRWEGLPTAEAFNSHLQALFELNPAIEFRHRFLQADGAAGIVLRIFIDKSQHVAKTADGRIYQRKGAQSLPITDPERITALAFAKGARSYEDTSLNSVEPEDVVESKAIKDFTAELIPYQEPLAFAVNEGIIDRKTFVPNAAGVLLFSDNPQAMFPKRCGIKIVFYDTRQEVPDREHLKQNIAVTGHLYLQIHEAAKHITNIMSSISIITKSGLKKVQYPPEAIWEILVNAVIHRDYSISDDIQVLIFQDRIEIKSPGRLPGFVTTDNFLDVRYSRNPKIVRSLARYRDAPNKDLGEGLNTAFQKMKEWRLKNPRLEELGNYVIVTIAHSPLASPEELVLAFLDEHPEIKNIQAREITGIRSENKMKDVFYRLRDQGLIELIPERKGNAAAWRRVPGAPSSEE